VLSIRFNKHHQLNSFSIRFMGKTEGRGMGGGIPSGGAVLLGIFSFFVLASCQHGNNGKPAGGLEWVRQVEARPQLVARCYYGPPEVIRTMIEELQDVARPVRGLTRFGNGAVAVGFKDERGRWMQAVECGGMLLVEGMEGQAFQLVVENKTDVILELLPSVDGLDLDTGAPLELTSRGRLVPPRARVLFGLINGPEGKAEPLRFRAVSGPQALYQISTTGTLGAVQVAIFLGAGTDTFDSRPPLARRNHARTFPQRRHEPILLPYQYR